ncbi:hypothetical protein FGRMN_2922 [Fusarium graminum]|nr:hypothetical protein FGRMN_2922 [Fusarium graminum]
MLLFQKDFSEVPAEFFQLLSCHSFTDFDVQDRYGATAMHRAALWGTAADVHNLLQLGASPCLTDTDLGWTPILAAASTNNVATLKRLAESMPADFVNHVDFKGWTLLHLGIEANSLETMTLALEMGADPYQGLMADITGGGILKESSPSEFARSKGETTHRHFIRALQITGHSISMAEEVDELELYWDAPEIQ